MDVKATIKKVGDKFQKLPTWGKVGIVGGTGLLLYLLFRGRSAATMSEEEVVFNLPYPDDITTDGDSIFDIGSVGDMTGSGSGEYIDFDSSLGGNTPLWTYDGGFSSGGGSTGANNWGFNTDWGLAGDYNITDEKPVNQPVLVQDNLISKENTNPNYSLYAAQLAYGNATTQAEREAAARAGELARKDGATDAGALAIWQANSRGNSGGGNSYNPNQALYNAQVAYGNAKTAAERAAAERAGQEARKNGATDSGAQAIWKSQSSGSKKSSSSSKSSSGSVKSSSSSKQSSNISSADRALQKAQAAYGAAKTSAERAAAAKAGEAARKAGATDKGAQAAWKSAK